MSTYQSQFTGAEIDARLAAVPDKVDKSDVANNLTTTVAGKVLDARQGKALSDNIGNQTYDQNNYIASGESATASLNKLDKALKVVDDLVSTNSDVEIPNRIRNGNFSVGTGWTRGSAITDFVIDTANNTLTFTGAGSMSSTVGNHVQNNPILDNPLNNLLYITCLGKSIAASAGRGLYLAASFIATTVTLQEGADFVRCSAVQSYPLAVHGNNARFGASTGHTVQIKKGLCVDLTATFGAGNEPTVDEMDILVSLIPDGWWDGTLKPSQKLLMNWYLTMIRANTAAILVG